MMLSPMSWRAASRVSGETAEGPVVPEDWAATKMGAAKTKVTNRKGFMRMGGNYSAFQKSRNLRARITDGRASHFIGVMRAEAPVKSIQRALSRHDRRQRCCIGGSRAIIEIPNDCHHTDVAPPRRGFLWRRLVMPSSW